MGVTGLWTVVAPTARPTRLETLNRKRLAVDASIWIYQFLKAVRDKEGNALRNSHVVGFFRRICKLLYFGIKPVFVFDGGAPLLKRETVRGRARRREGRREDAARTAGKLLAVQMARAAEEEEKRQAADRERTPIEEDLPADEELVYVDEVGMNQKERQAGRGFKRKDQYHLPDLDISIENMGAPNDPRIMSQAELEEYARQFHSGEEISFYDFSKIDFESPFFLSLPPGDRYNILNAARLRSRLRMGHSKDQLDAMFPDRMAFSKFQIERVKERNELTQRLMHLNGGADDFLNQGGRIAGEKGKEYVLVKNEGVEGGWALGVVSNKRGTKAEDAIDLEEEEKDEMEGISSNSEEEFEDVAVEGLNRIPKGWQRNQRKEVDYDPKYFDAAEEIARKRRSVYVARQAAVARKENEIKISARPMAEDADDLFVRQDDGNIDDGEDEGDTLFEDVEITTIRDQGNDEDDDLDLAISMSLQEYDADRHEKSGGFMPEESAGQVKLTEMNTKANHADQLDDDDEDLDLQTALAESRKSKYKSKTAVRPGSLQALAQDSAAQSGFGGILPFESLSLGQSLLGKKKSKKVEEDLSGGFDKSLGDDAFRKEKPAQPMPSWFEAAPKTNDMRHNHDDAQEDHSDDLVTYGREDRDRRETLLRHSTNEVIDLEAPEAPKSEPIVLDGSSSEDEFAIEVSNEAESTQAAEYEEIDLDGLESLKKQQEDERRETRYKLAQEIADAQADSEDDIRTGQVADDIHAGPPAPSEIPNFTATDGNEETTALPGDPAEELVDWSDSEPEDINTARKNTTLSEDDQPAGGPTDGEDDADFEDVLNPIIEQQKPALRKGKSSMNAADIAMTSQYIMADAEEEAIPDAANGIGEGAGAKEGEQYFSDSEEELMRQLAVEAEEHARFASSLNNKTPAEAARDYENELKQLRSQQKKDRRDADEVTQVMVQECQALLRLFGLPYITAPMEAEAQCAELVHLGLVDGIVTDDSDIFLFGGTRVYKNMFNAAKFVECYIAGDLEKEYALDREKLIRFAHLLGSDYTEGIAGVGPVTALEILTDFSDLQEFREWCSKVQLGRPQDLEHQLNTPFRRKFRNTVQKRLFLPPNFPDIRVDSAYLKPEVDHDPQEFQWGVPDLDKLRGFLMATIGWNQERTDEILVPVIKDMNKRELEGTQANITRFFSGGVGVGVAQGQGQGQDGRVGMKGKEGGRMERAYKRLRGEAARKRRRGGDVDVDVDTEVEVEAEAEPPVAAKKQPARRNRKSARKASEDSDEDLDGGDEEPETRPKRTKAPRKRRRKAASTPVDEDKDDDDE